MRVEIIKCDACEEQIDESTGVVKPGQELVYELDGKKICIEVTLTTLPESPMDGLAALCYTCMRKAIGQHAVRVGAPVLKEAVDQAGTP